jgi:hypothetical protein
VSTASVVAVGTDAGTPGQVKVLNPDGTVKSSTPAFGGFTGGVRVAVGDVNGDGVPDTIIGTGPGAATQVQVLDGSTGKVLYSLQPFEASFTGGVYVTAGDLDGDGKADIVVTPDEGGGPRVEVFRGSDGSVMANFFGIDDPNFRGGARAAVGDLNGDGHADLIVAAGFGGGPRVAFFDGTSLTAAGGPVKLFNDIFVFEQTLRNGVFVTAGDLNGDGFADPVFGGGPGGGPRVLALDGRDLLPAQGNQSVVLANFFAGDSANRGGVRVAAENLDGDAKTDLVVGDGTGAGSRVTAYAGASLNPTATPTPLFDLDAFPGSTSGVYVG